MNRKIRAAIVAAISVAAIFAFTASANAGTYTITQGPCQGSGWSWGGNNVWGFGVADSCAPGSAHVTINGTNSPGGAGFAYWKSPALPATAYLSGGSVYGMFRQTTAQHSAILRSCLASQYTVAAYYNSCAGDIKNSDNGITNNTWGWWNPHAGGSYNAIQIDMARAEVNGYATVAALNLQATENTAPSVSRDPGGVPMWFPLGSWNHTAWHRGVKQFRVGTSDANGFGVASQSIVIDGGTPNGGVTINRPSAQLGCAMGNWYPCPGSTSWTPDWDSRQVNGGVLDGAHTFTLRATDAANNVGELGPYGFKIDNTQPEKPSAVEYEGDGANGWSSTDSFDVNWTNGAETIETATQSGVSHVVVDVEPEDTGATDPAPVVIPVGSTVSGITATIDTLTGLTLGAPGAYRVGVGLRDLAGNWSSNVQTDGSNNPTGVTIDPDTDPVVGYDPTPPATPQGQANGWISRNELADGYDQEWDYNAPPGSFSPVCGFAGKISESNPDNPGTTINIPGDVREWRLPANLTEANHFVHLRAVTCAGLASPTTETVEAKVDLTDPSGNVTGVENGKWYKDGQAVGLNGTDVLSGMAPAPTIDPDARRGAYLAYTINGTGPADQDAPRGGSASINVTGEGQKELRFAPVDLAGNKATAKLTTFGIDATNPTGHFGTRNPDNPRLLRAPIGDGVSGIALSVIEVREQGSGDWKLLPTSLADLSGNPVGGYPTSAVASALFPDTSLPKGTYVGRVRAYDQAGNELSTSKDANGNTFTFDNPMRDGVALSAGLSKAKRTCGKKKGVKCVKKFRGKVVFSGTSPSLAVSYKRGAVVQGFLTTDKLGRLARQPIEIYTQTPGKPEILAGTTSTRADGSYVFKLKPGMSRTVRVYYPGTDLRQDASATVKLGTGAKLKLRVSKRHARTGQTVTFKGTVTSYDKAMPAAGKIIALQFYAGKKWRPAVAIAHTDSKGRFSVKYKFDGKRIKARIVFRVMAPTEDGWNHSASASKRITMKLN